VIESIVDKIIAEVEARRPYCLWCMKGTADGEAFCSPYCGEQYECRLMPRSGLEHAGISRPASPKMVRALHLAGRATRDRKLWQRAHPHEAG